MPNRIMKQEGNLLVAGEGETVLYVRYTQKNIGILVCIAGCIALVNYFIFLFVRLDERKENTE